jgi:hypothetical protein
LEVFRSGRQKKWRRSGRLLEWRSGRLLERRSGRLKKVEEWKTKGVEGRRNGELENRRTEGMEEWRIEGVKDWKSTVQEWWSRGWMSERVAEPQNTKYKFPSLEGKWDNPSGHHCTNNDVQPHKFGSFVFQENQQSIPAVCNHRSKTKHQQDRT